MAAIDVSRPRRKTKTHPTAMVVTTRMKFSNSTSTANNRILTFIILTIEY